MGTRGHAEIAGGGIGGLATAISLATAGWTVQVHEQGPELREFGAGVFMWSNALQALRQLGVLDTVLQSGAEIRRQDVLSATGETLLTYEYPSNRLVCIARQSLHAAMAARATDLGVTFRTSSRVVAADPRGSLTTDDGSTFDADLVVGADGVGSRVRDSVMLADRRSFCVSGATRLLIPRTDEERSSAKWHGTLHYLGRDHRRLLYSPCAEDWVYVAFGAMVDDEVGTRVPVELASWRRDFPAAASIIDRVEDQGRWDQYQEIRVRSWTIGKVALVGDAANAMQPHLGQGACLAIFNGLALGRSLSSEATVPAALAAWQREMKPLTDHTQRWARWKGTVIQDELPIPGVVRNGLVKLFDTKVATRYLNRAADLVPPPHPGVAA